MKICYIDETGSEENSPYYVMAGICFDFIKHSKCTRETNIKIANIKKRFFDINKKHCLEIKTKRFINGNDGWSSVPHEERDAFITEILKVFQTSFTNSFDIYLSVIDNNKYQGLAHPYKTEINSKWVINALHIILQRESDIFNTKKNKNNKALTFMIYDNHVEITKLNDLLYTPKKYLYEYFTVKSSTKIKTPRFQAVVGEGFCINSQHSGLCQLADICCYIIRRYIELMSGKPEAYKGEKIKYTGWYNQLKDKIYFYSNLYKKKPDAEILSFYNRLLPDNCSSIVKGKC